MKKFLSLALALIMALSLVTVSAGAVEFSDAEAITQVEAVGVMAGLGILEGSSDGKFNPTGTLTRGAAAKVITYMLEGTVKAQAIKAAGVKESSFPDVPTTSSNVAFIEYCAQKGIITGYSDGEFKRDLPVSSQAFLKMVLKALGDTEIDFNSKTNPGWVIDATSKALQMQIIDEDTVIGAEAITREDACAIAFEAIQYAPTEGTGFVIKVLPTNDQAILAEMVDEVYETKSAAILDVMLLAPAAVYGTGNDYEVIAAPATGSLGEKNWDLYETYRTDAFGRVTDTWTNGVLDITDDEYVEYAAFEREPVLTYTATTKVVDIAKALGYTTNAKMKTLKITKLANGVSASTVVNNAAADDGDLTTATTTEIGGAGTVLEVYKTATNNYEVIEITTTAYVLLAGDFVAANTSDTVEKKAHIWIDLDSDSTKEEGETVLSEGFKTGDVVLYTVGTEGIASFEKAKTVSGKVTAVAGDKSYIRIAGEKYAMSAAALDAANSIETGATRYVYGTTTYTYYLDNYNNIVKAVNYTAEAAEVETDYMYIFESASMMDGGSGLLNADDSYAEAQVKAYDLATGEIGLKNLAVVKNSSGVWKYAKVDGKASSISVDNTLALPAGLYEYYTMEDGTIVLIDGDATANDDSIAPADVVATTTISTAKGTATIATGKTATSATTMTVVKLVSEDSKIVSGSSTTVTGIANFSTYSSIGAIVTADTDTGIVSDILYVVVDASTSSTVKFATYAGKGEAGADGQLYAFYVKGEKVEYAVAEGKTVTLTDSTDEGKVFNLTLEDGKINTNMTASDALTADATKSGTVTYIDDTFMIVEVSSTPTVVYFASSYTVVDADEDYAIAEIAVDDVISVYVGTGDNATKAAFIVIDNA